MRARNAGRWAEPPSVARSSAAVLPASCECVPVVSLRGDASTRSNQSCAGLDSGARRASARAARSDIPTGLRPPARGCEERATLGQMAKRKTPRGLRLNPTHKVRRILFRAFVAMRVIYFEMLFFDDVPLDLAANF